MRAPDLQAAKKLLIGHSLAREVLSTGDRFMVTVEDKEAALGPLEESLKEAGLSEIRIVPSEPTLEELFVQIVRREGK